MKKFFTVALGLCLTLAQAGAASADVAGPCSCGGPRPDPSGSGGDEGGSGGTGGASGGSSGSAGSSGSTNSTTLLRKVPHSGNTDSCTEYAASPLSNPSGQLALGMGAFVLLPLARRRARKREK